MTTNKYRLGANSILYLIAILFTLIVGFAKYSPTFEEDVSLVTEGDGWGTVGWIEDLRQNFDRDGVEMLYGDIYRTDGIGGGTITNGIPINPLWRSIYVLTDNFVSTSNLYDYLGLICFILTLLAHTLLSAAIGAPWFFGLFTGFLMVGSDNFLLRQTGHLSLAPSFAPVLLIIAIVRLWQSWTTSNLILFATLTLMNFLWNEYYGYFGGVISILLFFPLLSALRQSRNSGDNYRIITTTVGLALLLVIAMAILYPTLLGSKIFLALGLKYGTNGSSFSHSAADFRTYAIKYPIELFKTSIPQISRMLPIKLADPIGSSEMTYRLGMVTPFVCLISAFFSSRKFRRAEVLLWLVAIFSYCLALDTADDFSLARITQKFAPMFRCSARALMYTNIAFMGLLSISLAKLFDQLRPTTTNPLRYKIGATVFGFLTIVLTWYDVTGTRPFFDPFPALPLPRLAIYDELFKSAKGQLIEFPIFTPPRYAPESDYPYFLAKRVHRKAIINGFPHSFNSYRIQHFFRFNYIPDDLSKELGRLNIRYIATHPNSEFKFDRLNELEGIRMIASADGHHLYEVTDAKLRYVSANFIKDYWNPNHFRFTSEHFMKSKQHFPMSFEFESSPLELLPGDYKAATTHLPLEPGRYRARISFRIIGLGKHSPPTGTFTWQFGNDVTKYAVAELLVKDLNKDMEIEETKDFDLDIDNVLRPDLSNASQLPIFVNSIIIERLPMNNKSVGL